MKIAVVAAAGMLLFTSGAFAEIAASASPPDAHKRELAHELIEAIHMDKIMDATMSSVQKSMVTSMTSNMPAGDQAKASAMIDASQEEMRTLTPRLIDYMMDVYATQLTEKELTDSLAFYRSDSGQSILAKTPVIMQQMAPFMQHEMPGVMRGMFRRYCVKVTCTAQEKAQFATMSDRLTAAHP